MSTIAGWRADVRSRGFVHSAILGLVWLTVASNGLAFAEPSVADALMLWLILLLPVAGFSTATPLLGLFILIWASIATSGFLDSTFVEAPQTSNAQTLFDFFLACGAFIVAGFIALRPGKNMRLIFSGLNVAAGLAAAAAIAGYFALPPSESISMTLDHAASSFNPHVTGPFLIPAILYALDKVLERPLRRALGPLAFAGLLSFAALLSFSRGAWINLAIALALFLGLSFATAKNRARQQKIALLLVAGISLVAGGAGALLQHDQVAGLAQERASMSQNYSTGLAGHPANSQRTQALILELPRATGAEQSSARHRYEEAHGVFPAVMTMNGWLGGLLYLAAIALTLHIGLAECAMATAHRRFVIIGLSVFLAHVAVGFLVEAQHWRHFYLMMALIWGGAASRETSLAGAARLREAPPIAA